MLELIQKTPGVMGGDACIRKTRIAVWMLVQAREDLGLSDEQIRDSYQPPLTSEDLAAAWSYAELHPDEIRRAIREHQEA